MLIYAKMAKIWTFSAKNQPKFIFQKSPYQICRRPPRACVVQISAQNHIWYSNEVRKIVSKYEMRKIGQNVKKYNFLPNFWLYLDQN